MGFILLKYKLIFAESEFPKIYLKKTFKISLYERPEDILRKYIF